MKGLDGMCRVVTSSRQSRRGAQGSAAGSSSQQLKQCAHPGCRTLVPMGQPRCAAHAVDRDPEAARRHDARRAAAPGRRFYKLKRWRDLRLAVLARDGWICQRCSVLLVDGRTRPDSAVVDHIIDHKGDEHLFFAPRNLQALCKRCHDAKPSTRCRPGVGGVRSL